MLVFCLEFYDAGVLALLKHVFIGMEHSGFYLGLLVAGSGSLLGFGQSALNGLQILQLQFGVDDFLVAYGVDGAVHVGDVLVLETAQHVDDSVRLADVSEKLIAQTFALRGSLHQSGNIHDFTCCRHYASWVYQFGQPRQALVGNSDDAHVWFNRTEGEICCLCLGTRQTVKKCRLAYVWQSYNTTFQ